MVVSQVLLVTLLAKTMVHRIQDEEYQAANLLRHCQPNDRGSIWGAWGLGYPPPHRVADRVRVPTRPPVLDMERDGDVFGSFTRSSDSQQQTVLPRRYVIYIALGYNRIVICDTYALNTSVPYCRL